IVSNRWRSGRPWDRKPIRMTRPVNFELAAKHAGEARLLEQRSNKAIGREDYRQHELIRRPCRRRPERDREGHINRLPADTKQSADGHGWIGRPAISQDRPPAQRSNLERNS